MMKDSAPKAEWQLSAGIAPTVGAGTTHAAGGDLSGRQEEMESRIVATPGVCGGSPRIRGRRIPVWLLVEWRRLGQTDAELLDAYPTLSQSDLEAAWQYYGSHREEIERSIRQNNEAWTMLTQESSSSLPTQTPMP